MIIVVEINHDENQLLEGKTWATYKIWKDSGSLQQA
jgi:hypothetical protein